RIVYVNSIICLFLEVTQPVINGATAQYRAVVRFCRMFIICNGISFLIVSILMRCSSNPFIMSTYRCQYIIGTQSEGCITGINQIKLCLSGAVVHFVVISIVSEGAIFRFYATGISNSICADDVSFAIPNENI